MLIKGTFLAAAIGAVLGAVEWITWRASRQDLPRDALDATRVAEGEVVLVLGCPSPRWHRWRVRIALRSTDVQKARLVFTGGAVATRTSEARLMADYAIHTLGVPEARVTVEAESTSTVENVANSLPLLADAPVIKIASDTFHARRARRILRDQSPELARRLVRTRDYLPFEGGPLHAMLIVHEALRKQIAG